MIVCMARVEKLGGAEWLTGRLMSDWGFARCQAACLKKPAKALEAPPKPRVLIVPDLQLPFLMRIYLTLVQVSHDNSRQRQQ